MPPLDAMGRFVNLTFVLLALSPLLSCKNAVGSENRPQNDETDLTIRGRVFMKSDVSTLRDTPLNNVRVVAFTADALLSMISEEADLLPATPPQVERLNILIEAAALENYVTDSSISDDQGRFQLSLKKGSYFLCLIGLGTDTSRQEGPLLVNGCVENQMLNDSVNDLKIYWGIGGVSQEK